MRAAAGAGAEALAPSAPDGGGAAVALAEAERLADGVAGADPELDALAERLRALRIEADDLCAELRRYDESLEAEPGRLEEVEARLEHYDRLERKHGGSVEAVLAHAERCRMDLERLERADVDLAGLSEELERACAERARLATALTKTRRKGAPGLAKRVSSVAFAEGGAAVVAVGGNWMNGAEAGEAIVWDFARGAIRHKLDAPALQWMVAVHPNGKTAVGAVQQAKNALIRNQTRLLGVVMNKLQDKDRDTGYGYGYGYGYGDGASEEPITQ